MNLEGVCLKLLLDEPDKEKALRAYGELRSEYLSDAFKGILRHIKEFYETFEHIPNRQELQLYAVRDTKALATFVSLALIDTTDVDIFFAIDQLADLHAQNVTLNLVDHLLDTISMKDRYEILETLASMPMKLEENIYTNEGTFTVSNMSTFQHTQDLEALRMPSGISNTWDSDAGGYYKQDLVLLGGKRGSGKSIVCANLAKVQAHQGNVAVYFTIEMTGQEVYNRIQAIETGIPFAHIKQGNLTFEEQLKLATFLSSKYINGKECLDRWITTNPSPDFFGFEEDLKKHYVENPDGQYVIIDDRDLKISTIDTKLAGLKAKYGDKLCLVVIDYLNQIVRDGTKDMYDWKDQIFISKMLKNLARKYNICIVSPYQMDDEGKARFSRGILDAPDVAQLIVVDDKDSGMLRFETTKSRSSTDTGKYNVSINWTTLAIDPTEIVMPTFDDDDDEQPIKKRQAAQPINDLELR